jgi:hypothetical protein
MSKRLRVKLDLPLIISHLSREEKKQMSLEDVVCWLTDARFSRQSGDYWVVAEADLGQVDPSEVLEVKRLDE